MELWNIKDFQQPPLNTYKTSTRDVDLYKLSLTIYEAILHLNDQKLIEAEAALLSRCIYRMKTKFRKDKSLKAMEKLNRVLLQYLRMNLLNNLINFRNLIPEKYETITYLPNCNLLEHILVRLQGLAKLMIRGIETTEIAAYHMENKIMIGHFWKLAFITFCVVSRIRILCKNFAQFVCDFYQKLLPFKSKLKNSGAQILPDNYELPQDLRIWLDAEWIFAVDTKPEIPKPKVILSAITCDEDSDVEIISDDNDDDIILDKVDQKDVKPKPVDIVLSHLNSTNNLEEDVGVVIERTNNFESKPKEIKNQNLNIINSINKIDTIEKLQVFINKEVKLRNKNIQKSSFKSLDKMQWNMILKIASTSVAKGKKNKDKAASCLNKAKDALIISLN